MIRSALITDAPRLSELVLSLGHYYQSDATQAMPTWLVESFSDDAFAARIKHSDYKHLVWLEDDELVGFIAMKTDGHLYHLFVSEAHQGKGIATSLWQSMRKQIKAERYWLRSSIFAVNIYRHFGFNCVGEKQVKDGLEFQLMHLES